jgi:hypothetical protein
VHAEQFTEKQIHQKNSKIEKCTAEQNHRKTIHRNQFTVEQVLQKFKNWAIGQVFVWENFKRKN